MFNKTYIDPKPEMGQDGTIITSDDMNTLVQELCNIITSVGWQPNASQSGQVASVLTNFYARLNSPKLSGIPTTTNPDGTVSNQIATVDYVNQTALSATVGFTPTQQGGGTGMGTDKIYIGTSSSDASNFLIQSDNNAGLYLTLGEDDKNTYGIRRFGFNHVSNTPSALDSNGTWHNLAEQTWVSGQLTGYLPLSGGELNGSLTIDNQLTLKGGININGNNISNSSGSIEIIPTTGITNRLEVGTDHLSYYQNSSNATIQVNSSGTTINNTLNLSSDVHVGSRWNVIYNGGTPYNKYSDMYHLEAPTGNIVWDSTNKIPKVDNTDLNQHSWGTWSGGAFNFYGLDSSVHNWATINSSGVTTTGIQASGTISSTGSITSTSQITSPQYSVDNGSSIGEIYFNNTNKNRWSIGKDETSETGSNTGGNFQIARFDDSGTYVGSPVSISRSTGVVTIGNGILVPTQSTTDNSKNAASTAFVKNNLANYAALNSYPTFQGINLTNGTAGASIYADKNLADIVFHTNDGTDHWSYFNANGNLTLSGNLNTSGTITSGTITASGDIHTGSGKWLYTDIVNAPSGTLNTTGSLAVNGNLNATGTITQGGSAVATETWVIENAVATPNTTSGSGDTRVEALIWSGSNSAPYIVHYQSDGSTSSPVLLATESWTASNYQPVGSYVTSAQYANDFSTGDSRVINLAYSHRIQAFTVQNVVHQESGMAFTFPQAFSATPVSIVCTTAAGVDMDVATFNWSSTGFSIMVPSQSASSNNPVSVIAIGPR